MKLFSYFWRKTIWYGLSAVLMLLIIGTFIFFVLESQLPDVEALKDVQLQVPMRIYTQDHKLIAEYGEKRRIPITLPQVPKQLINAVLATEDQRFYEHMGVDFYGLTRAAVELIKTGSKSQGGSTITMQVARNFFLSKRKTFLRKFKEILLAIKIDHELSKDKILELYLNKIYFGSRAYGVAAAAQVYYGKPLSELTLAQTAMIAGLPKAPSKINPLANSKLALERRSHVLSRMLELQYITPADYQQAMQTPITATYHGRVIQVNAPYVAEMVRQALYNHFGKQAYTDGFQVYTTINSKLQIAANQAIEKQLLAYDQRHGYRGPLAHLVAAVNAPNDNITPINLTAWQKYLKDIKIVDDLLPAVVTNVQKRSADVLLADGSQINLAWDGLSWANKQLANGYRGPAPKQAADVLTVGDVIRVQQQTDGSWKLTQVPRVEGAVISLRPNDGAILALVGGFNYGESKFNRVTQALRQPGSAFKPFIYSAALAKGLTLATTINDAPVVLDDPSEENLWRPQNDTRKFYGPTRLRVGLIRSRNLVSIRLLKRIGISYAVNFLSKFGFAPTILPHSLSLALGSVSITPLQLASAYAVIANGGFTITPYLVSQIDDENNRMIMQATPATVCTAKTPVITDQTIASNQNQQADQPACSKPIAKRVLDQQVAYLITQAMQDVIKHGTGRRARVLKRHDLAGKTGTTNKQVDAWFSGFNSDVVTTVWVGFDNPKSLHEYGAQIALPMWIDIMREALASKAEHSMQQPAGIVSARIDPQTGLLAKADDSNSIFEIFRQGNVPTQYSSDANPVASSSTDTQPNNSKTSQGAQTDNTDIDQLF